MLVLDDETVVRELVSAVLSKSGFEVVSFSDPNHFLQSYLKEAADCILLDLALPGISGLDVLRAIRQSCRVPVIIISGQSDISTAVLALKIGASDFVEKPFQASQLLSRVRAALAEKHQKRRPVTFQFSGRPPLTLREQEVLFEISEGYTSKEIASRLQLSPRTVESHRSSIMKKVQARNVSELVRLSHSALRSRKGGDWPLT